jgi:hypothetical protein
MAAMAGEFRRSGVLATGLAVMVVAGSGLLAIVRAEPVMTEVTALARAYGAGVHAYFSGDSQRAYDDLTQAIEAGTRDPRAWYFRGLAALKLGRLDEAEADFSTAATRETEAAGDWAVSRSLERVQGNDRLALERHRVRARVAGYEQRRQAVERRYSQIESLQTEMLRERRPEGTTPDPSEKFGGEDIPAAPITPPSTPAEPVEPAEPTDGVREEPAEETPAEEMPAEPAPDAAEPPMAEESPEPQAPAEPEATPEPEADAAPEAESTPDTDPADPAMEDEKPMATEDAPADPAAEPADGPAEAPEPAEPADQPAEPMAEDGEAPASADDPGSKVFDN